MWVCRPTAYPWRWLVEFGGRLAPECAMCCLEKPAGSQAGPYLGKQLESRMWPSSLKAQELCRFRDQELIKTIMPMSWFVGRAIPVKQIGNLHEPDQWMSSCVVSGVSNSTGALPDAVLGCAQPFRSYSHFLLVHPSWWLCFCSASGWF